ncbi:MAG: electron transfer flavoprotein subunit beta/FixA family protein [Kosmotogaceae bacterium]
MHIAVLVKQVPDTDDIKLDPETGTMIREGLKSIINPLDLNALEAALRIKEINKDKTTVSAITMGPPASEEALREAKAMGADETYLLCDKKFAGADTYATSKTLANALRTINNIDLIMTGEKAIDGETGQVGPEVGVFMEVPVVSYVTRILDVEDEYVDVERETETGRESWRVFFPCLLTITKETNEPRLPTLSGKKEARRIKIKEYSCERLSIDPEKVGLKGSPTRVVKIGTPKISREVKMFEGPELKKGVKEAVNVLKGYLEVKH